MPRRLESILPAPDVALGLETEELAGVVLEVLCEHEEGRSQCLHNFVNRPDLREYLGTAYERARPLLAEAWSWLVGEAMLAESPDATGSSVWYFVTRRGRQYRGRTGIEEYRKGQLLPKLALDPTLDARVRPLFLRGSYEAAVLEAFVEVEDRARRAARLAATDFGEALFRRAFGETGPLSDPAAAPAERLALAHLFAGAYGVFRSPRAHRRVPLNDPAEAVEIVLLANQLLRIVTARTPA